MAVLCLRTAAGGQPDGAAEDPKDKIGLDKATTLQVLQDLHPHVHVLNRKISVEQVGKGRYLARLGRAPTNEPVKEHVFAAKGVHQEAGSSPSLISKYFVNTPGSTEPTV